MTSGVAGENPIGLEDCRPSVEAPLREAPQDKASFSMPSTTHLMLRSDSAQPRRVSKHAGPPRPALTYISLPNN
jgi:hypothetical protein